jgi:ATP-binding cassette, subfamily B, heavy metal transporter
MGIRRDIRDINFKRNLKIYFKFVKKHKAIVLALMFMVFLLEVIRVIEKYLFKIIIDRGTEFSAGTLLKEPFVAILLIVAGTYIGVHIMRVIMKFYHLHVMNRLLMNTMTELKRYYYNHILHLSHKFHTSHKTGSLISRLIRGSSAMERLTDVFIFNVAPLIFQFILVVGSLIYLDLRSAVVIIIMMTLFIGYSVKIQNKQRIANLDRTKKEDFEKAYVSDTMTNIDSIKYFGKENLIKNKFKKYTEKTKQAYLWFWDYFRQLDAGQGFIVAMGLFFIMYFPILKFLAGEMTIGTIVFIFTLYGNLMFPLYSFVHGIRAYYRAMADFDPLFDYGDIENDIKDKPNAKKLKIQNGDIEFSDINFSYHKRKIFKNYNLKINKNQKVALVGHSGCGKTTLVKLLYRLYDPQKGRILIDGQDIRNFKQESLRGELSIVPQEAVLFDETIYNNIAFSNPKATRKEVEKAIKFAQLDKIIAAFPDKENTIVGERGVKLSGGEKQRVSIARAILANKKILVLDEATSSLDSETEYEIQNDLKKLMQGRTSIIIAHRLSTIMHADKIIVMDKGKIVQTGTHRELIRKHGQYRRLWNLQKGGYIK